MVLNFIKNIFLGRNENEGQLFKQNEDMGKCELNIEDDCIKLGEEKLEIDEIKRIKYKKDSEGKDALYLTTKDHKYKYVSDSAKEIYDILHPAIKPHKVLFETEKAKYFEFSKATNMFEEVEHIEFEVKICEDNLHFYMMLESETHLVHFQQIKSSTQYYMDKNNKTFVWSAFKDNSFYTFSIKFEDNLEFLQFLTTFVECTYKSVNKDGGDNKYYEKMFVYDDKEEKDGSSEENTEEDWCKFDEDEDKNDAMKKMNKNETNKHLIVDEENVFVTRGNAVGIFDTDLNFKTQIVDAFENPRKIITHNEQQNLLAQSKKDELDLLDLEKGEVIESWKIKDTNDFFNAKRNENNRTLIGIGDYNVFRIDPRTQEKVVESKEYKMKNEFSVGIATERGDVAVASAKGDLRLYNDVSKRAKSLINGFGDPIKGIDSSKDGQYILCTCKSYILLHYANENYAKALGKDKKPPKRLQLKPQHLSMINGEINFTTAKFDNKDKLIVCSTGQYLIKWKLDSVLKGDVYDYTIKTLYDSVVDENFVVNGDDIIVALPNDVKHVEAQKLRKPRD